MVAKEVAKNKYISIEGSPLDAIHVIASGSVKASFQGFDIVLKKGDIVGLCDLAFDSNFFTYSTLENSSFVSFPIKNKDSLGEIISSNPEIGKTMLTSILNQFSLICEAYNKSKKSCISLYEQITVLYDAYTDLCNRNNVISRSLPSLDGFDEFHSEEEIQDWLIPYYNAFIELPQDVRFALSARSSFLTGFVLRTGTDIHSFFPLCDSMNDYLSENIRILMDESGIDLFDLFVSLKTRLKPGTPDADKVKNHLEEIADYLKKEGHTDTALIESRLNEFHNFESSATVTEIEDGKPDVAIINSDLKDSLEIILEYSDVDEETALSMRKLLNQYKRMPDKGATDDASRKLRLELTTLFYTVYISAFQMSVMDKNIPTILKMFFNFGYMDSELIGIDNANYLYNIAESYCGDEAAGIYTIYEWLRAIFELKKEPSRNEFDTDYTAFLHEQKVAGKITTEIEHTLLRDPGERVMYELHNMFPIVNKVTYGRLSTFCPVLCESDIIKSLQSCLITPEIIKKSLDHIESLDYSVFYREILYTNPSCGISQEYFHQHIRPNVILFPNVGIRGVMWQEIEGKKRTTPARFMISAFHMEDIVTTLTRLTGEFRWEMCKREQGARWNDVAEHSLTSEYFDYVQFYRKNPDLSADAKEKVKASLVKAKNSFKELFIRDYITWILFESKGAPRLNKVARGILINYCPFSKSFRDSLSANPIFKELIERYEIKVAQKLHHLEGVVAKLKGSKHPVPDEFYKEVYYLQGMPKP